MKSYPIESLCYGFVNNNKTVVYIDEFKRCYDLNFNEVKDFKFIDYFEEIIHENDLDLLVTDIHGNPKKNLTKDEIIFLEKMVERKSLLPQQVLERKRIISVNIANIISDLLGLNIDLRSSTPFKFIETNGILVPARKLRLFKINMAKYIRSSIVSNEVITIRYDDTERDYRIKRSLNKAGIKESDKLKENKFSLSLVNGKIKINDIEAQKYQQEQSFQKVIKY